MSSTSERSIAEFTPRQMANMLWPALQDYYARYATLIAEQHPLSLPYHHQLIEASFDQPDLTPDPALQRAIDAILAIPHPQYPSRPCYTLLLYGSTSLHPRREGQDADLIAIVDEALPHAELHRRHHKVLAQAVEGVVDFRVDIHLRGRSGVAATPDHILDLDFALMDSVPYPGNQSAIWLSRALLLQRAEFADPQVLADFYCQSATRLRRTTLEPVPRAFLMSRILRNVLMAALLATVKLYVPPRDLLAGADLIGFFDGAPEVCEWFAEVNAAYRLPAYQETLLPPIGKEMARSLLRNDYYEAILQRGWDILQGTSDLSLKLAVYTDTSKRGACQPWRFGFRVSAMPLTA